MNKEKKGLIYQIVFEFLAGTAGPAIKLINKFFPSSLLVFVRFGLGSLFHLIIVTATARGRRQLLHLKRRQLAKLFILGVCGSGISSIFYVYSVRAIGVSLSTLISNLEIPIGIWLAAMFFQEKLDREFFKVAIFILAGFFLVTYRGEIWISNDRTYMLGVFAALAAALMWGVATVAAKSLLADKLSPFLVSFFRHGIGALVALVYAYMVLPSLTVPFLQIKSFDWILIFYLALVISGIGFFIYYTALNLVSVKKISLFFTIAPLVSVGLGVLMGEILEIYQWIGAAIVLGGIAFILVKEKKEIVPSELASEQIEG